MFDFRNKFPLRPPQKAIMELSASYEKRRLGKQQQILSEIALRCREQEVTDLSHRISNKVDLQSHGRGAHLNTARDTSFYSNACMNSNSNNKPGLSMGEGLPDGLDAGVLSPDGKVRRSNSDKSYKFFPARHIIRTQTKLDLLTPTSRSKVTSVNIPRNLRQTTAIYLDSYRSPRFSNLSTSVEGLNALPSRRLHQTREFHASFKTSAKSDPLAPLPRIGMMSVINQDRIDSFITASRLVTVPPRTKPPHDAASSGGRSYNSLMNMTSTKREANNKVDDQSVVINQMTEDDATSQSLTSVIGRGFGHSVDNLIG